jgi:amino acid transporter
MTDVKETRGFLNKLKSIFIGDARNPLDQSVMHNISLVAFFAWVGLGADGLSSSCYGPSEAFIALGKHHFLGLIIALATALTIFVIAESYSQIIELFPSGGGGYFVASRLLSPQLGMISGCALLIDYILTITLSVASGTDALFSLLPIGLIQFKIYTAVAVLIILILLNMRGVKESITVLMPIFMAFLITHAVIIIYALLTHIGSIPVVASATVVDVRSSISELGIFGMFVLLLKAYSLGAGTYTGIEAVSNGMPILREPKVKTAKRTMKYMVISLATVVFGLMFAYALFQVSLEPGKTLNAVLFEKVIGGWGSFGFVMIMITLISEAAILYVAAQTGFLGGPRVLANMAADKWAPKRFSLLSDRLVTMNGILIMGIGALILMVATNGSVGFLVVLYSINVFITFCLAQLGMVKHWWAKRHVFRGWFLKLGINGIGLILTTFILISVTAIKFNEGGWITLIITGGLVMVMMFIKMNYDSSDELIKKLNMIVEEVESTHPVREMPIGRSSGKQFNPNDKTAVVLVKDFTGVGLKTIFSIFKSFGPAFKNFVFVQVGLIDAAAFSGHTELENVKHKVQTELNRYVELMHQQGFHAEGLPVFGIDTVEELHSVTQRILKTYPNATFFGGQVVFPKNIFFSKLLHNYTLFSVQQMLYKEGIPFFVMPIELPTR